VEASTVRISLHALSFGYGGAIDIIREANLQLEHGWTGLVGANGCGKTTLLSLLAGELSPTGGSVQIPAEARVITCPQQIEFLTGPIRELASAWDKRSLALQARLALDPDELERWPTCSPGERKRWQIAAALAAAPDVLLLDEPTNHVDAVGRAELVRELRGFRGVGIVVSHDRALLGELTSRTVRMHGGAITLYPGSYDKARELWKAERASAEKQIARAERAVRSERRALADERRRHTSAERSTRTSARAKGRADPDARSMARKFAAQRAEARLGRSVQVQGRALERAERARARLRLDKEKGDAIALAHAAAPKRWLARLELDELRAGPRVLATDIAAFIERDSRVRIAGANGAGKTTLLTRLAATVEDPSSILLLRQELDEAARRELSLEARNLPSSKRGELFQLAASLGLDPERVLHHEELSPGEARKLLIARGLARRVRGIFLDEPTNHLDLPSIERLERALAAFPGALVLITHDDAFARSLTDTVWKLERQRLTLLV
jgi:ATPase subunit of ABC transporter with duplicated ATPase domains